MSSNCEEIQALIADIDGILRKMNSRLAWWSSGETRRVLERVRHYLDDQLQREALEASLPPAPRMQTPSAAGSGGSRPNSEAALDANNPAAAQQVWQNLVQDMMAMRANLLQPLEEEIAALRQERGTLVEQLRQLEQKQRHHYTLAGQQASQQQAIAEFLQALIGPLQQTLTEQVNTAIGNLEAELLSETPSPSPPSLGGSERDPSTAPEFSEARLLHPQQRLEQLRMLQAQSDRLLMSLDSTVRVVFESLERNVQSYNQSLSEGLQQMHNLGQQGEVMVSALVNHLAQLLGQETSSYLQSNLQLQSFREIFADIDSRRKTESETGTQPAPDAEEPETPQDTAPPAEEGETEDSEETETGDRPPTLPSSLLLDFPYAGAELFPSVSSPPPQTDTDPSLNLGDLENLEAGEDSEAQDSATLEEDNRETTPPETPKALTREELSQRNFEAAAEFAAPSDTQKSDEEDLLTRDWEPFSPSSPEEEPPLSDASAPGNVGDEEDLFAGVSQTDEAPEIQEEEIAPDAFWDELAREENLEEPNPPGDRTASPEKEPSRATDLAAESPTADDREMSAPNSQPEDRVSVGDLMADLGEDTEAIAPPTDPGETPVAADSPPTPEAEPSTPDLGDRAEFDPFLDSPDPDRQSYLPASPEEDLLTSENLAEQDYQDLWLDKSTLQKLDEDLSKLKSEEDAAGEAAVGGTDKRQGYPKPAPAASPDAVDETAPKTSPPSPDSEDIFASFGSATDSPDGDKQEEFNLSEDGADMAFADELEEAQTPKAVEELDQPEDFSDISFADESVEGETPKAVEELDQPEDFSDISFADE
ncbi:hypothetical protein LKK83_29650, partial [Phormidium sp. CCY1219]|nr:hypothetical protein [Phormidium sp. CCY1219]